MEKCICIDCTCTGCHIECYGHCCGCGNPRSDCNSYQTEGEKEIAVNRKVIDDEQ